MSVLKKKKRQRIADLEQKVLELQAQLVHAYHFARVGLPKAARAKMMGSAVVVRLNFLGGAEVCPPFALKDGMSPATIDALFDDLRYSYEKTTEFKP